MVEHDHTPMFYIMVVPLWWTVQIFTKTSPVSSVRGVGGKICLSSVILWTRSWATPLYSVQVDGGVHTVVVRKIAFRHFFRELCIGFPSFLQKYRLVRWVKLEFCFLVKEEQLKITLNFTHLKYGLKKLCCM